SNLRILSRCRKARATRSAKKVASLPLPQKRICSAHGTARQISSARARVGSAQHEGPAAQDVVNVLASGEVEEPRTPGLPHDKGQLLRGVVSSQDAPGKNPHRGLEQSYFFGAAASRTCHSTSLGCGDWTVLYRENAPGRKGVGGQPGLGREPGRPQRQSDPVPLVVGDGRERRPHVGGLDAAEDHE